MTSLSGDYCLSKVINGFVKYKNSTECMEAGFYLLERDEEEFYPKWINICTNKVYIDLLIYFIKLVKPYIYIGENCVIYEYSKFIMGIKLNENNPIFPILKELKNDLSYRVNYLR